MYKKRLQCGKGFATFTLMRRTLTARQAIRVWLAERDKTQTWLAAELGVSDPFLSQVLSGRRNATDELCGQLFALTGIDIRKLVKHAAVA